MRSIGLRLALIGALLLTAAGCATSEEWATWKTHSAHFATAEHLAFSVKNRQGTGPRVTRDDIRTAREQEWWGRPITVSQEQILER